MKRLAPWQLPNKITSATKPAQMYNKMKYLSLKIRIIYIIKIPERNIKNMKKKCHFYSTVLFINYLFKTAVENVVLNYFQILTTVSSLGTILTELSTSSSVTVTRQQFSHSDGSGIVSLHVTHGCSCWHIPRWHNHTSGEISNHGCLFVTINCYYYGEQHMFYLVFCVPK